MPIGIPEAARSRPLDTARGARSRFTGRAPLGGDADAADGGPVRHGLRAPRPDARPIGPEPRPVGPDAMPLRHITIRVQRGLPALVDEVAAAIRSRVAEYRSAESSAAVRRAVAGCLRLGVRALSEPHRLARPARTLARRVGTDQACRGVPLGAVLMAHRIGATMLWQYLLDAAEQAGPSAVAALGRSAPGWWLLHHQQCATVGDAYSAALRDLATRYGEQTDAVLDALLSGRIPPTALPAAAAVLDLPLHDRYAVVVVRHEGHEAHARPPACVRAADGVRAMWRARGAVDVAVVVLDGASSVRLADVVVPEPHARVGVSLLVESPGDLSQALRMAETAASICRAAGDIVMFEDRLPTALLVSQPELATRLMTRVLGPLLELEASESTLLIKTLAAWLDRDCSAARAAKSLYCHRNTVLNRLRRIEQLTGRNLADQRTIIDITLAMDAYRLSGIQPGLRTGAQAG